MRNWNRRLAWRWELWLGFQTTYEELKQHDLPERGGPPRTLPDYLWGIETVFAFSIRYRGMASRLPMRNWNSTTCSCPPIWAQASRLPMRNWNFRLWWLFHQSWKGFQTTYEELKLIGEGTVTSYVMLPDYLWGIETSFDNHIYHLQECFQTTYEELKLSWGRFPPASPNKLPDYLWGIETLPERLY